MTTQPIYLLLADIVLYSHMLVVIFVVAGLLAIVIGGFLKWRWVTNPWFRLCHLGCIGAVVMQAWAGVVCPLTTLEMWLRAKAGSAVYDGSFIAHWMGELLYHDWPNWVFTSLYTSFGLLVCATWVWVRPRSFTVRT